MAHIKSRKHTVVRRVNACSAAVAMAFVALPGAVHAQQASVNKSSDTTETLPQITVQGQAEPSYKADTVSSPKFTQPLVNTAQTISVIKSELVQQQGGTTLTEALRNSPGVSTFSLGENGATNTGDAVYLRGFDTSSSIFVDGIRDYASISRDMFNIEQVEVTKGPAGADNGRGAPTGSINLVTKQPTLKEAYSGSASYGSADFKRVTADLNKPLDLEGGAAVRINLLKEDAGVAGRDEIENNREGVAAAIAFGLKTKTRTYLNYLHVDQNNVPDGGVPTIGLPSYRNSNAVLNGAPKVDSSNFYGTKDDYDDVTADMFTARVEHDFSSDVKLQNTLRYGRTKEKYLLTGFMDVTAGATPSSATLKRTHQTKDQENEIFANQTILTMKFDAGAVKHAVVAGLDLTRERQQTNGYANPAPGVVNLYNPDPNIVSADPTRNGTDTYGQTDTISAYLFDTIELTPKWQLNGGIRVDQYDTDYDSSVLASTRNGYIGKPKPGGGVYAANDLVHEDPRSASGTLFNWKLGVLYKPTEDSSVYAAYATSKQPPGGSNFALSSNANSAANVNYDPQETRTAEIGGKWDAIEGRLALTGAIYRTTVKNEVEQDPITLEYSQTGKKRVQGIEIGAVGNITSAWAISTGYTIMDTEVVEGKAVAADGSSALPYTPKHAFTAWTTYKLPGGFTIGGGARYIGSLHKQSDGASNVPTSVESYWVYDAMASYTISKNVDLQLNLYNLTDEDYVASINKSGYRYTPGVERSARLTLNVKF
ncbi:MAG TPA: catecholate siderophore receptor Fiu [Oxalicibacterium sp.]|nr:catecholate siderophore receptor Fiu [Oxalicibacterium sp.]